MSNGQADIPKSTIAIGGAFWLVLVGLMTWVLMSMTSVRETQGRILEKLDYQQGNMASMLIRLNGVESRASGLETQTALLKQQVDRPH